MNKPIWLDRAVIIAVHGQQLAEHGGGAGIRDKGLLDSAPSRPLNLTAYGAPDIADLAAAYGFGIGCNRPFIDGNKRTAFVAVELFLELNGYTLMADDANCVLTMLSLAAGELEEAVFAAWIRTRSEKR